MVKATFSKARATTADKVSLWIVVIAVCYLLAVAYHQGLRQMVFRFFVISVLLGPALIVLGWWVTKGRESLVVFAAICAGIYSWWLLGVGNFSGWADGFAASIGFVVAAKLDFPLSLAPWMTTRLGKQPKAEIRILVFMAVFWLMIGVVDVVAFWGSQDAGVKQPFTVGRVEGNSTGSKVAVALSGGGYRAALLQAGIVEELTQRGIPIDTVSSVSGGSILALALHQGVSPKEFMARVVAGKFNLERALASPRYVLPALFDWLFPWDFSRAVLVDSRRVDSSRALTNARLLRSALASSPAPDANSVAKASRFNWIVGTTDIKNSQIVGAMPGGTLLLPIRPWNSVTDLSDTEHLSPIYGTPAIDACALNLWHDGASFVVAASGAFPGAFESVVADEECVDPEEENKLAQHDIEGWIALRNKNRDNPLLKRTVRFHLVDGGVADNTGIVMLQALGYLATHSPEDTQLQALAPNLIISADGGSAADLVFDLAEDRSNDWVRKTGPAIKSATDVIDFLYRYSGAPFVARGFTSPPVVVVSPRSVMPARDSKSGDRLYLLDSRRIAKLLLALPVEAVEHLGGLLAPEEAFASDLTKELQGCLVKARAAHDSVETLSSCLSSRGMGPKSCPTTCVFRELNLMLDTFAAAATLNARYSEADARMLFRLGQMLVVLHMPSILAERPIEALAEQH